MPGPSVAGAKKAIGAAGGVSIAAQGIKKADNVTAPVPSSLDLGSAYSPGKLEYHRSIPVLDPSIDVGSLTAHQKGNLGAELSRDALISRGGKVLGTEVTFDVPLSDGTFKRVRLDTVGLEADGTVVAIESKFGASASFPPNQKAAYPLIAENGVIPRGAKAEEAIRAGARDLRIGKLGDGLPIRVDHWVP